jgi:hypothetical protein
VVLLFFSITLHNSFFVFVYCNINFKFFERIEGPSVADKSPATPPFGLNVEASWEVSHVTIIFPPGLGLVRWWRLGKNRTNASLLPGPLAVRSHFTS